MAKKSMLKKIFGGKRTASTTELVDKITRQGSDEGDFALGTGRYANTSTAKRAPRSETTKQPKSKYAKGDITLAPIPGKEWKRKPGAKKSEIPEWAPLPGKEWKRKPKVKTKSEEEDEIPVITPTKKKKSISMIEKTMSEAKKIARSQIPATRVRKYYS